MTTPALAYLRTSSMTNVGEDKDSEARQRASILYYASKNDIEIIAEYYDPGVRGTDPIHDRPGFARMLDHIAQNGVRLILVENASRFARDLIVQELGHAMLKKLGVSLVPVDDPHYFTASTATGDLIRQILGAIAQFEKTNLVAKLKSGRDRKRALNGCWLHNRLLPRLRRWHRRRTELLAYHCEPSLTNWLRAASTAYRAERVRDGGALVRNR